MGLWILNITDSWRVILRTAHLGPISHPKRLDKYTPTLHYGRFGRHLKKIKADFALNIILKKRENTSKVFISISKSVCGDPVSQK